MSATKPWAYVTEFGSERVDAWEIKRQRDSIGGASLEKHWWSPHRKGERKRVTHKNPTGAVPHFSYIDGWTPGEGEGGESLSHVLYKNAIARLAKTQLQFPNGEKHDIRITHAELEKTIPLAEGYRVVDVYCKFESESHLAKKWGGEVCFEVWHTHRAPKDKVLGMKAKRVPVFQVPVPKLYQYRNEKNTSSELEKKHEDFLVGRLGEYMKGNAISDPSSVEYLEERVEILTAQMARDAKLAAAQNDEVKILQSELGRLKKNNAVLAEQNGVLAERNASLTTEYGLLKKATDGNAGTITRLGRDNDSLADDIGGLQKKLKYRKYLLIGTGVALAICLIYSLSLSFVGGRAKNDPAPLGTANEQPAAITAKPPGRAPPATNKSKAVKRKAPAKKINKKERSVKVGRSDLAASSESAAE